MSIPDSLKAVELWPIKAKGAVKRLDPLGDPKIEQKYHKSLEQGRFLENSIGDDIHWLLQKKQYVSDKIKTYTDMNSLAVDAQLKYRPRVFKLAFDSIRLLQTVNGFQQDIIGLTHALTSNIGMLSSIQQNMAQMVQANLNAIAILLNNICNWGLPDLPALPNLFSDTVWFWNGFNFFPLAAFKPQIGFDTNFSFNMCHLHVPNINIFRNYPSSVSTYGGLQYGTPLFIPPLGGIIPVGANLSDPNFIAEMQQTNTEPVYGPTFNPNSSMLGSVPDPATIISNYQMPTQTYHDNIVSIVPTLRGNVVNPTDPDYANPDLFTRQPNLRRDLVHFINLENVVSSNYDPYVTSAWLFYLNSARGGRSGTWLANYQDVYSTYIQPSILSLANNPVPWNTVLDGPGTVSTPKDIPLVDTFKALTPDQRQLLLWKLSYVEASLLGYTRSHTWDTVQDTNYLSTVTGADLDYVPTTVDVTKTSTLVLGQGTATYPVSCTYPTAIAAMLNEVIAQATIDINNNKTYQSPRLSNRFVYDQFAQSTQVDRFTQFWRDFNTNVKTLLLQDSYLLKFAVTYFGTLNGALNPLGDPTAYNALKADIASRTRSWAPGSPVLPIPKAPIVSYANDSTPGPGQNGWQGTTFDANAFLSRPDIQGQPIPVQIAMLRTNLSYAGLLQFKTQMDNELEGQINNAKALLLQAQQFGFKVEVTTNTIIPVGTSVPVPFDLVDFDITGNVTNPTTFTIQMDGEYALFGGLEWETPGTGEVRTVTVLKNGTAVVTQSTDSSFDAPVALQFTTTANFAKDDVVQVIASHTFPADQTIGVGSFFSMVQTGPTAAPVPVPATTTSNTKTFTAAVNVAAMTAIAVQPSGKAAPIDPTILRGHLNATITNIQVAGNVLTVACTNSFTPGGTIFNLSGLTTATFLNGQSITILTASPTQFTAAYVNADYPSTPDTGTANGGTILFPNPDGVSVESANTNANFQAGTNYGGVYQIAGASFTVGGLLYVGLNGLLTQDYNALLGQVPLQWVICVGRAMSADTFIYEPHIPTRILNIM